LSSRAPVVVHVVLNPSNVGMLTYYIPVILFDEDDVDDNVVNIGNNNYDDIVDVDNDVEVVNNKKNDNVENNNGDGDESGGEKNSYNNQNDDDDNV
jgi:hypothetical protein